VIIIDGDNNDPDDVDSGNNGAMMFRRLLWRWLQY
jgi:hypothetical protein